MAWTGPYLALSGILCDTIIWIYVQLCRHWFYIGNRICNWFLGPRDGDPLGPEILEVSWHWTPAVFLERCCHRLKRQWNSWNSSWIHGLIDWYASIWLIFCCFDESILIHFPRNCPVTFSGFCRRLAARNSRWRVSSLWGSSTSCGRPALTEEVVVTQFFQASILVNDLDLFDLLSTSLAKL